MTEAQYAKLAERHRRVLRLYAERYRLKDIARQLSLSENSVNTYLTEAVQILEAPGRRGAAEALLAFENPSHKAGYQEPVAATKPTIYQEPSTQRLDVSPQKSAPILPLRPRTDAPNRMPAFLRLLWMVVLLIMTVIGVAIAVAVYTVYVEPMESLFERGAQRYDRRIKETP